MEKNPTAPDLISVCYHCGDSIRSVRIEHNGVLFCCDGCKIVYEILQSNGLCSYYDLQHSPGRSPANSDEGKFSFLDDPSLQQKLLAYQDGVTASVTLSIPVIHCSSCIWLLEQLHKLNKSIISSRVNFLKKKLFVRYKSSETSLKDIVILLTSIGYEPEFRLDAGSSAPSHDALKSLYYKIGIAGFCFGNAMLFSFPEYLGVDGSEEYLTRFLSYLNLLLGVPVFLYCSKDYYTGAINGLRRKIVTIDVPIAVGIIVLFGRSVFEIVSGIGAGFIDSLCGLLFFLLLGKLFQAKTYDRLNHERNYQSYFPLAATIRKGQKETTVPISSLAPGDRIVIRQGEIIPADAILINGSAEIDYSFVTGESKPVSKTTGEMVHAGGKQRGGAIELDVVKNVSHSYLTQLWNNVQQTSREKGEWSELSNTVSKYFTLVVFALAIGVFLYRLPSDSTIAINALTGILIVACPCALAISLPFTLGTTMRIFAKNNFYLKNTGVVELLANVDTVVFDKTGTLTHPEQSSVEFIGDSLNDDEMAGAASLAANSVHPVSSAIASTASGERLDTADFIETLNKGIAGTVGGKSYKLGSPDFVGVRNVSSSNINESRAYLSINDTVRGYYKMSNVYRKDISSMISAFKPHVTFAVLSGDNDSERERLSDMFPPKTELKFNQSPDDKARYIKSLKDSGKKVLMVGDGLNDFGSLLHSNVGIAVSDNFSHFSPSSDAILSGGSLNRLADYIKFSVTSIRIVAASFILAFFYNIGGLTLAIQGTLTPVIAAILMPISSVTIVLFTIISTRMIAAKRGLMPWE